MPRLAQQIQRAADKLSDSWGGSLSVVKGLMDRRVDALRSELLGVVRGSLQGLDKAGGMLRDTDAAQRGVLAAQSALQTAAKAWVKGMTPILLRRSVQGVLEASGWAVEYGDLVGSDWDGLEPERSARVVGLMVDGAEDGMLEEINTVVSRVTTSMRNGVVLESPTTSVAAMAAGLAGLGALANIGVAAVHDSFRTAVVGSNEVLPKRVRARIYVHEGPIHRHNHPVSLRYLGQVMSKEDWMGQVTGWPVLHEHEHGWMRPVFQKEIGSDPTLRDAIDRKIRYFGDRVSTTGVSEREQRLALRIIQEQEHLKRLGPTITRGPRKGQLRARPSTPTPWERQQTRQYLRAMRGQGVAQGFERGVIFPHPKLTKARLEKLISSVEGGGNFAELREFVGDGRWRELR